MAPLEASPGKIGPYRVAGEIGRGATGVVLRGTAADGAAVAVKVLATGEGRQSFERFERERRLLAALGTAEGFVPLLDAGLLPDGRAWIAMPFVAGGTLRARLARGPLDVPATVALGVALARALGVAHARGIVHRDVKPENVLFTEDGAPLLADLGIAKHFAGGSAASRQLSRTGEFRGTPLYVAPEQSTDAARAGPASDVYALGVVLYECLAGAPPVQAETILELLARKAEGRFAPLATVRPDVPPWLARVVEGALAAAPDARPRDGAALARALAAGAPPPRGRAVPALLALGLVLLASGGAAALVVRGRDGKGPGDAEPPGRVTSGLEADLASLAAPPDAADLDAGRRAALARVRTAPDADGALDEAVARAPTSRWLRRARLARRARTTGPLDASDLRLALDGAPRDELESWLALALARGLAGPDRVEAAVALRAALPPAGRAALLAGRELLEGGRRDEALPALRVAARDDRTAAALVRAAEEVDRFARARDATMLIEPGALLGQAPRMATALGAVADIGAGPGSLAALVAPVTSHLRGVIVERPSTFLLQKTPLYAAFEQALEPVAARLPDTSFAVYEIACRGRRPVLDSLDDAGIAASRTSRRPHERIFAALPVFRATDPDLAVEAVVALILDKRGPRELALAAEAEGWSARPLQRGRCALSFGEACLSTGLGSSDEELPGWLERAATAGARADVALKEFESENRSWNAHVRAKALLVLGRLEEAEAVLAPFGSVDHADLRAEILRRRGDAAGAIVVAREGLARDLSLGGGRRSILHASLAVALTATGDRVAAREELAEAEREAPGPQRFLLEIPLARVREIVTGERSTAR